MIRSHQHNGSHHVYSKHIRTEPITMGHIKFGPNTLGQNHSHNISHQVWFKHIKTEPITTGHIRFGPNISR